MVREKETITTSTVNRPVFVRLTLPAGEAISAPPLSAILGQVQINTNEFCKSFNAISLKTFKPGVLLSVCVYKNQDNTFYVICRGVQKAFMFFQISNSVREILLEHLYDIFRFDCFIRRKSNNYSSSREFFGALRSSGFKITFLFL